MADRLVPGFMPTLTLALQVQAEAGNDRLLRIQAFSQTESRFAAAFHAAWDQIYAEGGGRMPESLADTFARAAREPRGVQGALTTWRDKASFQALDVTVRALASNDLRRAAWTNLDRFSTVWVSAWPTAELQLSSPEFLEVTTWYLGLPSPACAAHVGEPIANTRQVVDQHGARLCTARLPGDGWRIQHDAIKWRIVQDAREMHLRVQPEVYGLFAASIPQAGRRVADGLPRRKRQGLVPDFMVHAALDGPERPLLMELKTLHYGRATYPERDARCHAVLRRARALPAEYAAKAREVDRRYCGTPEGTTGPVEMRLRSFEPVRGLVFGA